MATVIANGSCGASVTWTLTDEGLLTISGTGAMYDASSGSYAATPFYEYAESITEVVVEEGITYIGYYNFYIPKATKITLPASITSVHSSAFCKKGSNKSLEEFHIPDLSKWLAVSFATDLEDNANHSYRLSAHPMYSGKSSGCDLYVAEARVTTLIIPEVTTVPIGSFTNCSSIEYVEFPSCLTSIPQYILAYCNNLRKINIPDTVTKINAYPWPYCPNVTEVNVGNGVTEIPVDFWRGLSGVKKVTIGRNVSSLDPSMLSYWGDMVLLEELLIAEDNEAYTSVDNIVYTKDLTTVVIIPMTKLNAPLLSSATKFNNGLFQGYTALESYTIPSQITVVPSACFWCCTSLTHVSLHNKITEIAASAFYGCEKLAKVAIPTSVTIIRRQAFYGCISLTEITIPAGVTVIADGSISFLSGKTFYNCTSLSKVVMRGTTPPSCLSNVFTNHAEDFVIYVPVGTAETYKAATGWSSYADYIMELDASEATGFSYASMLNGWLLGSKLRKQRIKEE